MIKSFKRAGERVERIVGLKIFEGELLARFAVFSLERFDVIAPDETAAKKLNMAFGIFYGVGKEVF